MLRYLLFVLLAIAPISDGCQVANAQPAQQQAIIQGIKSQLDAAKSQLDVLSKNIEANKPVPPPPPPPPPTSAQPTLTTPIAGKTWTISFADEFNGTAPDATRWNPTFHWWTAQRPYINGETAVFVNDFSQTRVANGILTIRADRQANGTWKTECITTMGKMYQTYGFFEARLKLPRGSGAWPGFWNMREDKVWPDGEVDILESNGNWPKLYAPNAHWAVNGQHQSGALYYQNNGDLGADFHTYGLHWQPGKYEFFLDGKLIHTIANAYVSKSPSYMLLSLEVAPSGSSSWPGTNASTPTPMEYSIDYVRTWK